MVFHHTVSFPDHLIHLSSLYSPGLFCTIYIQMRSARRTKRTFARFLIRYPVCGQCYKTAASSCQTSEHFPQLHHPEVPDPDVQVPDCTDAKFYQLLRCLFCLFFRKCQYRNINSLMLYKFRKFVHHMYLNTTD